jgi:hypothetical protein
MIVGAPLYPFWSNGLAVAVGAAVTATAVKPINSDLHRCECSAMAAPLSSVLPSAYGPQLPLTCDLTIMPSYIITATRADR